MHIDDFSSAPRQQDFLRRLLPALQTVSWTQAIWLAGSFARGDADRWSNVNLHLLVDETATDVAATLHRLLAAVLAEGWHSWHGSQTQMRGFTLIPDPLDVTRGGVHFDLHWTTLPHLHAHLHRYRPLRLLAAHPTAPADLTASWPALIPPHADQVAADLAQFWIVLSALPALLNRAEHLAAAQHLGEARQILTDLVVALNGAQRPQTPARINQYLGPLQRDAFEKTLVVPRGDEASWIGQAVALIVLFRWYAPQLVEQHRLDYPITLERSVLALLSAEVPGWPALVKSS